MKSVLISIQPKWCELIASGKKTIEVRKTRPKIDEPFKCYIYCTNTKPYLAWGDEFCGGSWETKFSSLKGYNKKDAERIFDIFNGKVIGEFVCDKISCHDDDSLFFGLDEISNSQIEEYSCLSLVELFAYKGDKEFLYAWHISDLVIYDKPKELREFFIYCGDNPKCDGCEAHYYSNTECGKEDYCCSVIDGCRPLKRPPQSWCYVDHPTEKGGER